MYTHSNVTREIIPHFRKAHGGTIINITSIGGQMTFPFYSVYHTTKWATEGFSESLQFELQPFNIRVKMIEPGAIATQFYGRSLDVAAKEERTPYSSIAGNARAILLARKLLPTRLFSALIHMNIMRK